jgi:hypothetical protein
MFRPPTPMSLDPNKNSSLAAWRKWMGWTVFVLVTLYLIGLFCFISDGC